MKFKKTILLVVIFILYSKNIFSYVIDLTELPAYIKQGFDHCNIDLHKIPNNNEWLFIPPNKMNRSIKVAQLSLPNLPKRRFLEFRELPKSDFTLFFIINFNEEQVKLFKSPGIYFERIGESWEIYWNQISIDKNLSYSESRTTRGYIVEIPLYLIKKGENILCIHLVGDPLSTRTGFYYGKEYYIDELKNIFYNKLYDYFLIIFLITLYTSFGMFNIIFYLYQKENKYNLYFSLFCFLISIYIFARSPLVQYISFLKNPDISSILELVSLFLLIPIFSLFFYDIFKNKINKKIKLFFNIGQIFGILLSILVILPFVPSNAYQGILFIWQISAIFFILIFAILILYFTILEFKNVYKKNYFFLSIIKTLLFTVPGNFFIGVIFLSFFVIIDIYINIKKIAAPSISNYGFLFFLTGISFRLAYNIIKLLNQLKISESKYKNLYNDSSDILIVLDKDFCIKDINQRFEKILNWNKEKFLGSNIEKLIYKPEKERNPILNNFNEYLKNELEKNNYINVVLPLISNSDIPFRYFEVEFRIINDELIDESEIFMKCAIVQKNPIVHYLVKEYQRYEIPTDFIYIERILPRITESQNEFFDEMQLSMIRIALREILINAIEHGNLEITSEEKTNYLLQGNYDQFLKERLKNPAYCNKKIIIEYKLIDNAVLYKITDEGKGFDVEKYLSKKEVNLDSFHGRGIFITKNAFDKVYYNKKGNSVVLIKNFQKNKLL